MTALVVATGGSPYTRHPKRRSTLMVLGDAARRALRDARFAPADVDGLAVASFSLVPDRAADLAWRLGLSLNWLQENTNGGASGVDMLGHAVRAVEAGDASTVLVLAGDVLGPRDFAVLTDEFNSATREHLAPLEFGGPNALFAMLTARQMSRHGLTREDYGRVAIAQRTWAQLNPGAVYRTPLTMSEYLAAPLVADPLCRYDCVPVVVGADALIVTTSDRRPQRRSAVRVLALRRSFNHDHQRGDGLQTGLRVIAPQLWQQARVRPSDVHLACVYDDYPAIVLAQLADLGFAPDEDLPRLVRSVIADRRLPVNTSGGQLSAGQAGIAGGLHGVVEAVRQLQHLAGERQVPDASLALATGYGMALYRYGAAAAAAVLERVA